LIRPFSGNTLARIVAAEEVPVLVVGGSLVGLSAAVFLGARGAPSLVVERHVGTAIHPRAALVNQRTMENYRSVGIEEEIAAAAAREFVQNGAIVSVESLGGKELEYYFENINEGVEELSPCPRLFITQIGLEPVLLRKAEQVGAEVQYASEIVGLDQDTEGVTATIRPRDGGPERTVRARYVLAADGAHSPVRKRLEIPSLGHGSFSDSITIYFRADVRPLLGDRNLSVVYVFNPRLVGFFRFSIDGYAGFLVVNATFDEEGNRSVAIGEDTSEDTCIRYVREALGAPDLPVQIENVQRWAATADWAERFSDGRILLAGDAVHVMPPTGGFGGNCGVQDAFDLAWKLQYVLDGVAPRALLDTYDTERRPVGSFTTEQAYTRYVLRLDPGLGKENLMPIVHEATVELGYRHVSDQVTLEEGDDGALWEDPHEPSGRPGMRAPHVWIDRDGERVSTLDLFCSGFTLVAGAEGSECCAAANAAAERLGVPLDAYRAGTDFGDPSEAVANTYGIGAEGAALVRPDGFIAWRAGGADGDVETALARALVRGS
jgi:2-polyprenyl-6-methoxyphenol hydroxylase-like FAD-dependent oxidoreductase